MKVLAIRGRNLASLEGEFAIDFTAEPLASSNIFAISGVTGSGKSTLLDALCLALFAKTPRTEQAKKGNVKVKDINDNELMQNDPRFLLRRGTATGYAEADFFALNGHRYRARWSVSRAREKENGKLQQARISLINLDTGEEETGRNTETQNRITELIGLTFEQFTRSVLLAQNDFSTFLKADHDEKASLLEKLTGTEMYSVISRHIYERNGEAKVAYDNMRIRIDNIELLPDEEEQTFRVAFQEIEKKVDVLEKQKKEQQALLDAITNTTRQITDKQTQHKEATEKLTKAVTLAESSKKESERIREELQAAEESYKKIQPELQTARKLDVQIDIEARSLKESEATRKKAEKELSEVENKQKTLISKQKEGKVQIEKITAWREKYRSKEKIAEQLSALLLHLDQAAVAYKIKEKAETACRNLKRQIEILNEKVATLRQSVGLSENEDINLTIVSCRDNREKLLLEQARFVTEGNIKSLRDKLSEGVPCPVCGSMEHPYASPQIHERQEKLKQEIAALTLRIKQLENLSKLLTERKEPEEQLPREENERKTQSGILAKSLQSADELFGNDEWQINWFQEPEVFRKKLTVFAGEWNTNKEQLALLERQQSIRQSEQETVESFLVNLRKQKDLAEDAHKKKENSLLKIRSERAALLGGRPADQTEKEYLERLDKLKTTLNKLTQTYTEQSDIAGQLKGTTGQISIDLTKANEDLARQKKALEEWTTAYTDSTEESIPLDNALSDGRQQKNELAFRLRKQEENKKKMAGLQEELDKKRAISERWAKLNDLLGSSDGAKFRRIAQGYTLDVLLNYANVQLKNLTNRYYLERVPDSLALQVIDRDMCDEARTVHSLSGGESFLVSLALALGLSALSSNRMKVESLFIDEGFGSLDADTLRIALDALENLRTQGRKIGVISHVQEMTERIPVQIKVNRAGNGRSFLEIC